MDNDTNLRFLIRTMVQSSAYQLSSRYDGEWKVDYVPLFARHYPRRMWAEEVHDAIVQCDGGPASLHVAEDQCRYCDAGHCRQRHFRNPIRFPGRCSFLTPMSRA